MASSNRSLYLYEYMEVVHDAFMRGKTFRLDIIGNSMSPTLREGDSVILDKPDNIKKGDIILYQSGKREYTLHRVKETGDVVKAVGDNNIIVETVEKDDIIAKVVAINKGGKVIKRGSVRFRMDNCYAKCRRLFRRIKNKVTK